LSDIFEISCFPGYRTSVIAKNMITSTNPYTNQKTYILGNVISIGPERHIANEIGLLITFLIAKFDAKKSTVKRVFQNITCEYLNKEMNLMNYLKSKSWMHTALNTCNRGEIMSYAFIMFYLFGDVEVLQAMAKQSNQFSFHFENKDEKKRKRCFKRKIDFYMFIYVFHRNFDS